VSLLMEADCSLYWRTLSMVHQLRYINEPRPGLVQIIPCADCPACGLHDVGLSREGTVPPCIETWPVRCSLHHS